MIKNKKIRSEEDKRLLLEIIWVVLVVSSIIVGATFLVLRSVAENNKELPPYEEQIVAYEVVSVYKYARNKTNIWGEIIDADICYNFSYISDDKLCHVEDFIHRDNGKTKVTIGDSDCYIVNKYTDEKYLQLTKETLKSLTGIAG